MSPFLSPFLARVRASRASVVNLRPAAPGSFSLDVFACFIALMVYDLLPDV